MFEAMRLLLTSDYSGDMRSVLGEEDSHLVDMILSFREAMGS